MQNHVSTAHLKLGPPTLPVRALSLRLSLFVFFFERETERERESTCMCQSTFELGRGQRERNRQFQAGSTLSVQSPVPDAGLKLTNQDVVT